MRLRTLQPAAASYDFVFGPQLAALVAKTNLDGTFRVPYLERVHLVELAEQAASAPLVDTRPPAVQRSELVLCTAVATGETSANLEGQVTGPDSPSWPPG